MDTSVKSHTGPNLDYARYLSGNRSSQHISHKANLSGATMLDLLSGPEGSIAAAYQSSDALPHAPKSRRPSYASSTTTHLRQTNRTLVEIVQNAQSELATQRQAMLDMHARILQLESILYDSDTRPVPRQTRSTKRAKSQIKPSQNLPLRIEQHRDTAAQTQVTKLDRTSNRSPFWDSPSRFSGFNFNFDLLETVPDSQPHAQQPHEAPEVYYPSGPDPNDAPSTAYTPGNRQIPTRKNHSDTLDRISMYHDAVSDIKEHVIEFEKIKVPLPPLLHSPPKSARSKMAPTTYSRDEELTALPRMPAPASPEVHETESRGRKGIKSMFMYRTFSKSFRTDCSNADERRSSHYAQA